MERQVRNVLNILHRNCSVFVWFVFWSAWGVKFWEVLSQEMTIGATVCCNVGLNFGSQFVYMEILATAWASFSLTCCLCLPLLPACFFPKDLASFVAGQRQLYTAPIKGVLRLRPLHFLVATGGGYAGYRQYEKYKEQQVEKLGEEAPPRIASDWEVSCWSFMTYSCTSHLPYS